MSGRAVRIAAGVCLGAYLVLVCTLHSPEATAAPYPIIAPSLRVCADPDNMPYSNRQQQGFENRIAQLVAHSLHRRLIYVWSAQGHASASALLDRRVCDLVIGMPTGAAGVDTTYPYYWSSYVLLSRADRGLRIVSLADHRLGKLRIGVEAVLGKEYYSPPARVLLERGLRHNIVAYPRVQLVDALVAGHIDIAAVWGPAIGYWVRRSQVPLRVTPIGDTSEFSSRKTHFGLQAMQYQISMAVRAEDGTLRSALDRVLLRHRAAVEQVLEDFAVPLIDPARLDTPALARATVPSDCEAHACAGPP